MVIKCHTTKCHNYFNQYNILGPYIRIHVSGNLRLAELAQVLQAGNYRGFSVGSLYQETSQLLDAPLLFFLWN